MWGTVGGSRWNSPLFASNASMVVFAVARSLEINEKVYMLSCDGCLCRINSDRA
jgi:hypothetical protein